MVKIGGQFQLIKNVDFLKHLVALGIPEEKARRADSLKPVLQIDIDGKNIIFASRDEAHNTTSSSILTLNEEVDEFIAVNIRVQSKVTMEGNKITINSRGPNGETGTREFEFFDDELVMTLSSETVDVPIAKRYYKRQITK